MEKIVDDCQRQTSFQFGYLVDDRALRNDRFIADGEYHPRMQIFDCNLRWGFYYMS